MIRILVIGSKGRMGTRVINLIKKDSDLHFEAGWDRKENSFDVESLSRKNINGVVDFSSSELFFKALSWSVENKVAFVSGTTGFSEREKKKMQEASKAIPFFWASNMSLGLALLKESLKVFSQFHKDFDFQIEEFHHRGKKDKPSGTALTLQEELLDVTGESLPEVLSVRGGGVFGVHRVWALAEGETLCFEHTALNRDLFASGALKVLKWLVHKSPGFYSMKDFFKEKKQ